MTQTDNPWSAISPPNAKSALSARRVDSELPWDFFWALDVDRNCLLVLNHRTESSPTRHIPQLKDIVIDIRKDADPTDRALSWKLHEPAQRDLFFRLCTDIVQSTISATTEKEAVELALARTWRWHHLLRSGTNDRLTQEEQKGLIGELLFLERWLLPNLLPADAVACWAGPLGSPKDFEVGRVGVEVKSRRGAAQPFVTVNSEFQLDQTDVDELHLFVVVLDSAPSTAERAFTLTDVAKRISDVVSERDPGASDVLDSRLLAAGFRWEDDYTADRWLEGSSKAYLVAADFPKIDSSAISPGVSNVRYAIALAQCEPFLEESASLSDSIREAFNGN